MTATGAASVPERIAARSWRHQVNSADQWRLAARIGISDCARGNEVARSIFNRTF